MGIKCEETQDHFKSFYVISRKSVLALVLLSQMFPEVCTVSSFRANNSSEHFALIPLWYFRHSSLSNNPPTNLLVCYIINSPLFFFFLNEGWASKETNGYVWSWNCIQRHCLSLSPAVCLITGYCGYENGALGFVLFSFYFFFYWGKIDI